MTNTPSVLDRREFIVLASGLAAVLVIGDGAYLASRRSAAHAQPAPSESGTLAQPATPLDAASASSNAQAPSAADPITEADPATPADAETPPTALEDLPWNLRLVNRKHPLDADFEPGNLAELPDASWVEPHVNHRVDARIVEDLAAMLTAAEAEGAHPVICSSFRTYDYQENLFENRIERAER
ncbi:D-alanyl-D-alanine carboxypeptidase family protein, partial [Adlercreutzia equolifaciens]|uniref:D-alanyl-D-alanine carboxypeptidase family protein n=2 Tax=Adlercreutzia TaxID=447020 RepID=UPI003AF00828